MSSATMTLIGMYNWDNTLFDNLQVPDGVDKATLIDNILIRSGEFEVLYSDFDFMKFSIGAWSRKWYPTLERWVDALSIEYNPLENYDRQEDWTDFRDIKGSENGKNSGSIGRNENGNDSLGRTENGSGTDTESRTENTNQNGSESRTENSRNSGSTTGTSGSTTTTNVSAYDGGSTYTPKEQLIVSASDGTTSSGAVSLAVSGLHADTISLTVSGMQNKLNSLTVSQANLHSLTVSEAQLHSFTVSRVTDDDLTHSGRIHGNIGVTTSQQMLLSELQLGYWNIYEKITDIFLTEFVIPVY